MHRRWRGGRLTHTRPSRIIDQSHLMRPCKTSLECYRSTERQQGDHEETERVPSELVTGLFAAILSMWRSREKCPGPFLELQLQLLRPTKHQCASPSRVCGYAFATARTVAWILIRPGRGGSTLRYGRSGGVPNLLHRKHSRPHHQSAHVGPSCSTRRNYLTLPTFQSTRAIPHEIERLYHQHNDKQIPRKAEPRPEKRAPLPMAPPSCKRAGEEASSVSLPSRKVRLHGGPSFDPARLPHLITPDWIYSAVRIVRAADGTIN